MHYRYREHSIDKTDSDDLLDIEYNQTIVEEEIDTIERVVDHRIGKKGGMLQCVVAFLN